MRRGTSDRPVLPKTRPTFSVPKGACDCHVHVNADRERFPLPPHRHVTMPEASIDLLHEMQRILGLERYVLVQSGTYGTDNSYMLECLKRYPERGRGIAVLNEESISDAELDEMNAAGVRGVRVTDFVPGRDTPMDKRIRTTVERTKDLGWHIQLWNAPFIELHRRLLEELPVPVVIDHFAGLRADAGPHVPGYTAVFDLLRSGKAYIKLSALPRVTDVPDFSDMMPLAKRMIETNPDRILWATDWTHSHYDRDRSPLEPTLVQDVDDGVALNLLAAWAPDPAVRERILVGNPAALYGF
jgi:predicted TIM-barrel fold metal-dependent hydrolase